MRDFVVGNRKVGHLTNDGTFIKSVNSRKHKMRVMNAYGISECVVSELEVVGCKQIEIRETDTRQTLRVGFQTFNNLGARRTIGGFETQVFLPINYWDITKDK